MEEIVFRVEKRRYHSHRYFVSDKGYLSDSDMPLYMEGHL